LHEFSHSMFSKNQRQIAAQDGEKCCP